MHRTRVLSFVASLVMVGALAGCYPTGQDEATPPAEIIRVVFDGNESAVRVADCESSLNPEAVSPGGGNHGLFQLNSVHRDDFEAVTGQSWSMVLDAYWNTVYARHLYDDQGWRPWTCRWAA